MREFHAPNSNANVKKTKRFFPNFIRFLKSTSISKHCEAKDEPHSLSISGFLDSKINTYLMPKRPCLRKPYGKQRVNGSQTLLKSARKYFYLYVFSFQD